MVEECATEVERDELLASGVHRSGIALTGLVALAEDDGDSVSFDPDPDLLVLVAGRARLRKRLRLPASECAAREPTVGCECLRSALDELAGAGADGLTRRRVLAAAKQRHCSPPRPYTPPPEPIAPIREATPVAAVESHPEPEPEPERRRERERDPSPFVWRSKRGRDKSTLTASIENYKF